MPFSLTNAPATCQTRRFVNDTLREYLNIFCVCYLDDILIYTNFRGLSPEETMKKYRKQVRLVLRKLQEAGLFVKPEKYEFETRKPTFLGFVISPEGIEMDPEKVSAVKDWETPTCIRDVQCFLGFAHFYRRFINGFSRTCTPRFNLLKKFDSPSAPPDNPGKPVKLAPEKAPKKDPQEKALFPWNDNCDRVFQ